MVAGGDFVAGFLLEVGGDAVHFVVVEDLGLVGLVGEEVGDFLWVVDFETFEFEAAVEFLFHWVQVDRLLDVAGGH